MCWGRLQGAHFCELKYRVSHKRRIHWDMHMRALALCRYGCKGPARPVIVQRPEGPTVSTYSLHLITAGIGCLRCGSWLRGSWNRINEVNRCGGQDGRPLALEETLLHAHAIMA